MAKFNKLLTRVAARSPIVSRRASPTFEGGPGFARDAKGELFLLAVANMVGEDTFYEAAGDRDDRYERLVGELAVADPEWMGRFLGWLRSEANMRSASLVGSLQAARAMLAAGQPGSRALVAAALQRADEPGEALAYWTSTYGRAIPKPVKRGIADAVRRLYTEYALLKYDTAGKGFRFGDVIELTHPVPTTPRQGDLFAWALARRHERAQAIPSSLTMVAANAALRVTAAQDPRVLLDPLALRTAGMTWEDALSLAGSTVDKAALWTALIPSLGYMALLRNLRNFDAAGVPDAVASGVAARLSDPAQVATSRQFPFRFLAAHRAAKASLRWGHPLERALHASLANVPTLSGRTLILVDLSGSMAGPAGGTFRSTQRAGRAVPGLSRADVAKVFGAGLALRTKPTLVWFDDSSGLVEVPKGISLLALVESFPRAGGGTSTGEAVRRWYDEHDRIVIVTDEQAHYTGDHNVVAAVPAHVRVYTWNLGGYRLGHAPSGLGTRHTFGGLTDQGFRAIPPLERDRDAPWPF